MKLGLHLAQQTWPNGPAALGADLARVARTADEAGFEYLSVMDHFFQISSYGPPEHEMLEAWTTLGFLAAHTERVKLLTLVTGVIYRHPGLLAKAATTLDVLSGGRAILGIGAGWNEEESRALGFRFPPMKERFEQLEDALRYVHQMWAEGDEPFTGTHVSGERLLNSPQPIQRPHPPILIGGSGEKKTLRFVAQYGDICNLLPNADLPRKLEVLQQHCADVGRDYSEITKTASLRLDTGENGEKTGQLLDELGRLSELGFTVATGWAHGVPDPAVLERFATEVIPAAEKL
ncbi:LLM class F420-dependent oxidoreductase [Amycolatopsis sp. AA4]|uniref:LLM class F420-dependent oxidoreductase n=1 Tax=Actinomycetes TaxID=1760 RepID=UPI0001B579E9|nr:MULTISPECIES: LLM class F420-dependent oxidoreductase [Actinomycetes]ATY09316.1 LLM class F420-dependent oxidoreductase [Amycolatopsis sp. AA4]EFL04638.1 luciferase [Streptomyces sp. AA4]